MAIKKSKNKQLTPSDSQVSTKAAESKGVYNFPPSMNAPAMQIEAGSAREAEEIYQKKVAALSSNK